MVTFIASIFVFSLVILVHEFGHFKMAKNAGIKIEEFAIGMGPVLYKKTKDETVYSIRALPIGGFVRMEGEEEDIQSPTSFNSKTVWQRFKVIAAGPVMNILLAVVIYIIISIAFGVAGSTINLMDEGSELYKAGVRPNDKIISVNDKNVYIWDDIVYSITESEIKKDKPEKPYTITIQRDNKQLKFNVNQYYRNLIGITPSSVKGEDTKINTTSNSSPAYKAGVRSEDRIISVNGVKVNNFNEIRTVINSSNSDKVMLTIDRAGKELSFDITPNKEIQLGFNTKMEKSLITALVSSVYKTGYYIKLMIQFIGMLFTGQLGSDAVGGPVQVISMVGETAKLGIQPLLDLAAFISINLGFMNLLPIPALDGSKLVFLIIEGIRRKKIPVEKEGFVHFIGFIALLILMVFVTYKDIVRLLQ